MTGVADVMQNPVKAKLQKFISLHLYKIGLGIAENQTNYCGYHSFFLFFHIDCKICISDFF